MNIKRMSICLLALCLLTGCSKKEESSVTDETTSEITSAATKETTVYTTQVTTAVTTEVTTIETTAETTAVSTEPPRDVILKGTETLEVYRNIKLKDFIKDSNVTLKNGDSAIKTNKTGKNEVIVSYTYKGNSYEQKLTYTVRDTTAPLLINGGYNTIVKRGTTFDLDKHVGYGDNYDKKPTLTYTGKVNTGTCGKYPLTATVTDSSGNKMSWQLTVTVAEEIPTTPDNNKRLQFNEFVKNYSGDGRLLGIDVSKWQGEIDFKAVKNAGCSFVIMRIGHYRDKLYIDEYYKANIANAKAAGLKVGVYFYSTANSAEQVRYHAQWIAKQLGGQKLDFPVAFDWESFTNYQKYGMSIYDLNRLYDVFADEMSRQGYPSMLYSSKTYLDNFWEKQTKRPVWLAHYTMATDYSGEYALWQMSCRGRIAGINGDVDLDILYPDKLF